MLLFSYSSYLSFHPLYKFEKNTILGLGCVWACAVLEACSGQARLMLGHGPVRSIGPHFLILARSKFSCRAEQGPLIFVLMPCRASFKRVEFVPCWRCSLMLKKKAFDKTITELEKKKTAIEVMANEEVLEKSGNLLK